MNKNNNIKVGLPIAWYKRKWWLKSRELKEKTDNGLVIFELYYPWYFKPLEYIHNKIFGIIKLEPIERN